MLENPPANYVEMFAMNGDQFYSKPCFRLFLQLADCNKHVWYLSDYFRLILTEMFTVWLLSESCVCWWNVCCHVFYNQLLFCFVCRHLVDSKFTLLISQLSLTLLRSSSSVFAIQPLVLFCCIMHSCTLCEERAAVLWIVGDMLLPCCYVVSFLGIFFLPLSSLSQSHPYIINKLFQFIPTNVQISMMVINSLADKCTKLQFIHTLTVTCSD